MAGGVGACKGQYDSEGCKRPVAYASEKLTPTQRAWLTIEREAYVAIWALKRFETWLFGAQNTAISDLNPLTYVVECAPKSAKLTRWALALQEFELVFKYRKGTQHSRLLVTYGGNLDGVSSRRFEVQIVFRCFICFILQ